MAFKSINHDNEKIFYNRLWKLMEERNLSTARELAQALYAEEIVPVDSASEDEISIIGSMTRRIQEHLNLEGTDKLQGRYVKAYCDFFGCSADYLFGLSSIKSENPDVIRFCEATGLSEKSVRRLIEDLPEDIKRDLVDCGYQAIVARSESRHRGRSGGIEHVTRSTALVGAVPVKTIRVAQTADDLIDQDLRCYPQGNIGIAVLLY